VAGHELPIIASNSRAAPGNHVHQGERLQYCKLEAIVVEACQASKVLEATPNGQTTIVVFLSRCTSMFDLTDKDDKRHHQHAMKRPEPWDIDHIAVLAHHATVLLQGL
jgi:hypothetical protein